MVYIDTFGQVVEVCSISEPIVKVMRLVDGDKPAMAYLYEAMDRAKEAIRSYYADKGFVVLDRRMMLWDVIDSRWIGMLHRIIHATTLFLNLAFSYKCGFDFDGEVMEDSIFAFIGWYLILSFVAKSITRYSFIGIVLAYLALIGKGPSSCHVSDKSSLIRN